MFENYQQLSAQQKAEVKSIHKALRAQTGYREGNLLWGFVRGFPYKRLERSVREGHQPVAKYLTYLLAKTIPGFADVGKNWWDTKAHPEVEAWLLNPGGAIPAPVKVKLPPGEARVLHESRKKVA